MTYWKKKTDELFNKISRDLDMYCASLTNKKYSCLTISQKKLERFNGLANEYYRNTYSIFDHYGYSIFDHYRYLTIRYNLYKDFLRNVFYKTVLHKDVIELIIKSYIP